MLEIKKAVLNPKKGTVKVWFTQTHMLHKPADQEGAPNKLTSKGDMDYHWKAHPDLIDAFDSLVFVMQERCEFGGEVGDYQVRGVLWVADDQYKLMGSKNTSDGQPVNFLTPKITDSWSADKISDREWEGFLNNLDRLESELQKYIRGQKYEGKQLDMFAEDGDDALLVDAHPAPVNEGADTSESELQGYDTERSKWEDESTDTDADTENTGDSINYPDWGAEEKSGPVDEEEVSGPYENRTMRIG